MYERKYIVQYINKGTTIDYKYKFVRAAIEKK